MFNSRDLCPLFSKFPNMQATTCTPTVSFSILFCFVLFDSEVNILSVTPPT